MSIEERWKAYRKSWSIDPHDPRDLNSVAADFAQQEAQRAVREEREKIADELNKVERPLRYCVTRFN